MHLHKRDVVPLNHSRKEIVKLEWEQLKKLGFARVDKQF